MTRTLTTLAWTLTLLTGCRTTTEPNAPTQAHLTCRTADGDLCLPPPPPPPGPGMDTLRLLACPVASVWQFDVDRVGNTYTAPGVSWYLPPGATMLIPATVGTHWMDLTRWSPTIGGRQDSVTTGVLYQLPCS